jgi:hypothetical protein
MRRLSRYLLLSEDHDQGSAKHMKLSHGRFATAFGVALVFAVIVADAIARDTDEPKPAPKQPAHNACNSAKFKIALDVGHYRARPGAISARG